MRKFYIIGFLLLLTFDTVGQFGFKLGAMHTAPANFCLAWFARVVVEPWVWAAVGGYIGAFFTYMTLLEHAPIGPAFAVSHLEIVTVMIASFFFLGERLDAPQIIGSLFIVAGILVLASGQKEAGDPGH